MAALRCLLSKTYSSSVSAVRLSLPHFSKRTLSITSACRLGNVKTSDEAIYNEQHVEMRQALNKLIEKEINPHVEEWEEARSFPVHTVIKKLGDGGFLGPTREVEYGGLGLDYTYSIAIAEELGNINCGGVPMAIGVHSGKFGVHKMYAK